MLLTFISELNNLCLHHPSSLPLRSSGIFAAWRLSRRSRSPGTMWQGIGRETLPSAPWNWIFFFSPSRHAYYLVVEILGMQLFWDMICFEFSGYFMQVPVSSKWNHRMEKSFIKFNVSLWSLTDNMDLETFWAINDFGDHLGSDFWAPQGHWVS